LYATSQDVSAETCSSAALRVKAYMYHRVQLCLR
jgi:hypothetical protein